MSWVLPTYNRPEKCADVLRHIKYVGCSTPGTVIVNGVDKIEPYRKLQSQLPSGWTMVFLPVNVGLCGAMQFHFLNRPTDSFYGLICDDEYVHTPGWDKKLIERAGNFGIAHGNENWQSSHRLHTYVTWGGDLLRSVGWWALPGLWQWYFDDVWETIATALDLRRFCDDVRTEHKHYLARKAEKDQTYRMGESRADQDQAVFRRWKQEEWPKLLARLKSRAESLQHA